MRAAFHAALYRWCGSGIVGKDILLILRKGGKQIIKRFALRLFAAELFGELCRDGITGNIVDKLFTA